MNEYLLTNNFFDRETPDQKALVEAGLKEYLLSFLKLKTVKTISPEDLENITINELVEVIGETIPAQYSFQTIDQLTHCLLNIASNMQGWQIVWRVEQDPAYIDAPVANFNSAGNWDELVTHNNTSCIKSFEFAATVFKEHFKEPTKDNKGMVLSTKQLYLPKGSQS